MSENTTQQKSLKEVMRRFLEPIIWRKKNYFKYIIQSLFIPIVWIVAILFLERITIIIQLGDFSKMNYLIIIFFIFVILSEIIIYSTKNWWWMNTLYQTMDDLFNVYLKKYISLDNNKVEKVWTWKLVGIMYDGIFRWSELLAELVITGVSLIVGIIFTMYMIARINIFLPIIFLLLIILFCFITFFINKKLLFFRSERYEYKNLVLKDFVKVISSKNEILQSWKLNKNLDSLSYYLSQWSRISKAMSPYRTINKRSAPFLLHISLGILFFYIIQNLPNNNLEISFLVWLSWTFVLMQKTVADFVKFYTDLNKQFVSIEKIWDFFDTTPQIQGYEEWITFNHKNGTIELKNLSFGYDENNLIFKNFSLKLQWENVTAFVGPSGWGKSTLVKLIAGYIRANRWEIIIDGQKLSKTSLKSYYRDIGYLNQEPSVFDGTVRENLLYALSEEIPENTMKTFIYQAHADFIYDLPQWLDTEIWERGVKLSGGQKQRLAIAKIFLKNPKIIILDEPTSALDSISEKHITKAMHNLFKNRTVLVIAHRLQTVKHADDIIVIEKWSATWEMNT